MSDNKNIKTAPCSLSSYYPEGTVYFYGIPCGVDSDYYGDAPREMMGLVTGRPLTCSGPHVSVLAYHSAANDEVRELLESINTPLAPPSQVLLLPKHINESSCGLKGNDDIRIAIREGVPKGTLISAQPFTGDGVEPHYCIDPALLVWFNDKLNMSRYILEDELPRCFQIFKNGAEFKDSTAPHLPNVVKVASSGGGWGVEMCTTEADYQEAQERFADIDLPIFVEEQVGAQHNLCVQFGIPHDGSKPCEIIGFHEQVVADNGDFLGGVVDPSQSSVDTKALYDSLLNTILPNIRKRGWYGVGSLDVLIDERGKFHWIDPNMRMTATIPFVFQAINGDIKKKIATFGGEFFGDGEAFRQSVLSKAHFGAPDQLLDIIALSNHNGVYRFLAGFLFDREEEIPEIAEDLLAEGIHAETLEKYTHYPKAK